jgi:hypothetical protein
MPPAGTVVHELIAVALGFVFGVAIAAIVISRGFFRAIRRPHYWESFFLRCGPETRAELIRVVRLFLEANEIK